LYLIFDQEETANSLLREKVKEIRKKKGIKIGWFDRKKKARGEDFKGKRFRRKKLNQKKSQEVVRGRLEWQS